MSSRTCELASKIAKKPEEKSSQVEERRIDGVPDLPDFAEFRREVDKYHPLNGCVLHLAKENIDGADECVLNIVPGYGWEDGMNLAVKHIKLHLDKHSLKGFPLRFSAADHNSNINIRVIDGLYIKEWIVERNGEKRFTDTIIWTNLPSPSAALGEKVLKSTYSWPIYEPL